MLKSPYMRYIGNKEKILYKIDEVLKNNGLLKENLIFFDAFSGTGTVSDRYKNIFNIVGNDNLWFAHVFTSAKLNTTSDVLKFKKLGFDPFAYLNNISGVEGFIYNNYSVFGGRMYFNNDNARKIDSIRITIEEWYKENKIDKDQYYFLIASLLDSVSKVANVAGVYGAFLKTWDPRAKKNLIMNPLAVEISLRKHKVVNYNAEDIAKKIKCDILYLDPPYTKNQYSVQYHILETIAKYDQPKIKGITGARGDRDKTSSFSKNYEVHVEFEKLIAESNCSHIIVSYSSQGIMSKDYISAVLKRYGKADSYYFDAFLNKRYENHQTNKNSDLYEYIFYVEKKSNPIYQTPINYMGNKYKLIQQIRENLPDNIDTFIDLFGGGFNVGINIEAKKIIYNDINYIVADLVKNLAETPPSYIYKIISTLINKYNLSKGNRKSYELIRNKYNETRDWKILFVTLLFGYQQQMRFNSKHEFNNPVGQSGFNDFVLEEIISYNRVAKNKKIVFVSKDFEFFLTKKTKEKYFFYIDPPYLITLGSYNDGKRGFNGWNVNEEIRLLSFLDKIDNDGHSFMLSNMLQYRNQKNSVLYNWIKRNGHRVINVKTAGMRREREEILVMNYNENTNNK